MTDDTIIGRMTENLIDRFVDETKKKKYREKIMQNIVDPVLQDIEKKYLPYVMTLFILLILIIIIMIVLLVADIYTINNVNNATTAINAKIDEYFSSIK